jgi:hypothetical protein
MSRFPYIHADYNLIWSNPQDGNWSVVPRSPQRINHLTISKVMIRVMHDISHGWLSSEDETETLLVILKDIIDRFAGQNFSNEKKITKKHKKRKPKNKTKKENQKNTKKENQKKKTKKKHHLVYYVCVFFIIFLSKK